jgi:DNA topoisomerase-3
MGKRLVITEKPSVARDIVGALGGFAEKDGYWERDDYLVTFAVGHLLELVEPEDLDPKYKRWTLDTLPIMPKEFPLKPKEGASERLRTIKSLVKRSDIDTLVNACDAGREGELIFREIAEYLEAKKPIERLWLQSMTRRAIVDGFKDLRKGRDYEGLSAAAHCRNYADWLIGMNATRALTRRLKTKSENQAWSAGRVQTPTLAMLVNRELEVLAHRPVPYWRIIGAFSHEKQDYTGTWFDPSFKASEVDEEEEGQTRDDRIFDEAKAKAIADRLRGKSAAAASETRKPSREAAPFLFDLTSLQREANRRFGWSARRTLNAAQRCYEGHKILTYPRTDSRALPKDYRAVVDDILDQLTGDARFANAAKRLKKDGLLNEGKIFDDSQISDHFAIVPTGVMPERLEGDDARLFDLVVRRFLAAFHPPALWSRVERTTVIDGEHFRSRAKILQEPGWREVLSDGDSAPAPSTSLMPLVPGKDEADGVAVKSKGFDLEAEETKPPARITEARLLSLMENAGKDIEDEEAALAMKEKGIGTPATRADTIENLLSKGYAVRPGRFLRPTVKGIRLIDILRRMHADRLASPVLTGELEQQLADVEHGRRDQKLFMNEIYEYTQEIVDLTKTFEFDALYPNDDPLGPCPLCGRQVYERSWFYRCKEPAHVIEKANARRQAALSGTKKNGEVKEEPANEKPDCPFRIWKDKSGRYIDRETVRELLHQGKSPMLDGFTTRQGRTYKGTLEIEDGQIVLKRAAGAEGDDTGFAPPEYEVNETPLGKCPVCKEGDVMETRATFVCSKGLAVLKKIDRDETTSYVLKKKEIPEDMQYCPFLLPRTICKREITREEAEGYLKNGRTEQLTDFISQRGRPFSATLFLRETGRHGFEFPPRGGGEAKSADGSEPPKKRGWGKKRKEEPAKATQPQAVSAAKRKRAPKKEAAPAKPKRAVKRVATAKSKPAKKSSPKKKARRGPAASSPEA